ncbi:conjugal transfer protein TraN [Acidithiobacillus ferriphilus]|uniref:conjugal transfer protein TraN n=1 Tax=Acidithiobacillus ferriphilus TaxID=1689834 RepID=UPI002DB97AD3|nr:conjugal transfer protein TraN [Acidithiobacillus ferriphilus]MEB8475019.1 conjugal transfer protein TraN [Acidithiobacillus ferriphilus]
MGFFVWMGHPKRQRRAAVLFMSWMVGMGIYYESTATAEASTFINQAQSGANFGNSLLMGGQSDAANNAGTTEMQGFAGMSPTGGQTQASSYYLSNNVGMTPGNALNQADSANSALMSDPSCPAGWPGPLNTFQQNGVGSVTALEHTCQAPLQAARSSIETAAGGAATTGAYAGALAAINAFQQAENRAGSAGNNLETSCAPVINGSYQYAPACNLLSQSGTSSVAVLGSTWNSTIAPLESRCSTLYTSITNPTAAQGLTNVLTSMTASLDGLIGTSLTGGAVNISNNGDGAVALPTGYGTGQTQASQQYQQILGACTYAQSYLENISAYPGGMNAYASDPMINNFMSNPANQPMINNMMPFIESNPSVFGQYYQNVACTNNNTSIANASTTATGPSTTTTSAPSLNSNPVACTEPLSTYESTGWITNFPDPNAQWIYGVTGGCGAGVPNGQTDLMEGTYSNTTGAPINATLYLAADDEGIVNINGTQVASYSDGGTGGTGAQAYPATGGVVSVPITLSPGPDEIMYYITNSAGPASGNNPSAGILSIIGTVNGQNQVLIDTNSSWVYVPQNAAQAGSTVTVNPGSVTANTTPNTHAQSILCNSPIQCMGTQCHALFGNQDLHFNQALTALSALQQMEQGAMCATGTSIAAGNCQPIIFGGVARYCRTWPAGGVFTNNCCAQGLKDAGASGNLANYLLLAHDTWKIANAPIVDAHVWGMGAFHGWVESAYSSMNQWAATSWRYVTTVFKGAAEAVSNAFGIVGSSASTSVGVTANAVTSGTSTATTGLVSTMELYVKDWLMQAAAYILNMVFGPQMAAEIMTAVYNFITSAYYEDIMMFFSVIGWIYMVYQILQIIGNLLTACKNEEFKLGQKRKLHACQNLGTYCVTKVLGICMEHKDVFCCYASPLSRIIASQIRIGQPNVAGGYGTAQNPQCGGFTVQQLAAVDWAEVSLSAWQAMLQNAGLISGSNAQGAATYTPAQIDHPAGDVNISQAPISVGHGPVVAQTPVAVPTGNPNAIP